MRNGGRIERVARVHYRHLLLKGYRADDWYAKKLGDFQLALRRDQKLGQQDVEFYFRRQRLLQAGIQVVRSFT